MKQILTLLILALTCTAAAHAEVETTLDSNTAFYEGETLNYMEVAHSRLSSLARNFVVKYADDQRFDYDKYVPIEGNADKHPFFSVIGRNNNRMQHLALLTRLLILEEKDGPSDIRDSNITEYVKDYEQDEGIGNWSMESLTHAKNTLGNMRTYYDVFKEDVVVKAGGAMRELRTEYFIISTYLLLRHLRTYYVFDDAERKLFHQFVIAFHRRWRDDRKESNTDILVFSDNRQQTGGEIHIRDRIIRQAFFEHAGENGHQLLTKDERRSFSEAERIRVYRRNNGLCQECLAEGKPDKEAQVPWSEYQTDHVVPHARGGPTVMENAQVLCRYHNARKGARF